MPPRARNLQYHYTIYCKWKKSFFKMPWKTNPTRPALLRALSFLHRISRFPRQRTPRVIQLIAANSLGRRGQTMRGPEAPIGGKKNISLASFRNGKGMFTDFLNSETYWAPNSETWSAQTLQAYCESKRDMVRECYRFNVCTWNPKVSVDGFVN